MENLQKLYPIQTGINNPILRCKSINVEKITDEIKQFAKILLKLMRKYDGVGLAAPQIGKNIRMIAITIWDITGSKLKLKEDKVLINPIITYYGKELETKEEGCLSLPGISGQVQRAKKIKVEYYDINNKKHKIDVSGLNARIIQHEIDHLDGILFVDKIIRN